jgi:hypothetical protein
VGSFAPDPKSPIADGETGSETGLGCVEFDVEHRLESVKGIE